MKKERKRKKKKGKEKLSRLEIREREMEIRKKNLEIKKEEFELEERKMKNSLELEEQRLLLEKIGELRWLLSEITVDEEKTILGSEPFLRRLIDEEMSEFLVQKLRSIVEKI